MPATCDREGRQRVKNRQSRSGDFGDRCMGEDLVIELNTYMFVFISQSLDCQIFWTWLSERDLRCCQGRALREMTSTRRELLRQLSRTALNAFPGLTRQEECFGDSHQ